MVLANNDRVTVRVGDSFLKIDADRARTDREVDAINLAPVPTPQILWRTPPVLALAAVPGQTLGRLGTPSHASRSAWMAAGATVRTLHDAPLPPWPDTDAESLPERLNTACEWLGAHNAVEVEVIDRNRRLAERVFREWDPVFIHGDLHLEHLFVDGDDVTGIIDWSEARHGDALYDVASLTLANADRLDDFCAGYGDVDRDVVSAWWSMRCLCGVPWLIDNGYGEPDDLPEVAVLRAQAQR